MSLGFTFVLRSILAVGMVAGVTGCGSSRPSTYKVTGTVTLDGMPVEGANVGFTSLEEEGRTASGVTDSEGKYELTTFERNDGALPGKYKVRVFKYDSESGGPEEIVSDEDYEAPPIMQDNAVPQEPQHLLPTKYAYPSQTPLSYTVESNNDNVFDIKIE